MKFALVANDTVGMRGIQLTNLWFRVKNSQSIQIRYGYVRNLLLQTCLSEKKCFGLNTSQLGPNCNCKCNCKNLLCDFFPFVYLGLVTSLPASICCSQKAWYFCKLSIKNNWQFSYWARIQHRVSDQLQLIKAIGRFQKIFIHIHGRPSYFNNLTGAFANSKMLSPTIAVRIQNCELPFPLDFQFCLKPLEFLVSLPMTSHKRDFALTSSLKFC